LLIRLAAVNHYHYSVFQVQTLCRQRLTQPDRVTQPVRPETYQVISDLVGLEPDELYAASLHRFAAIVTPPGRALQSISLPSGQTVLILDKAAYRPHLWSDGNAQFCPACLKEAVYHRVDWIPMAVNACLQHRCLLVRTCPQCQYNLEILDILETECRRCGLALTEITPTSLADDASGLLSQSVIQSWLGLSPPTHLTGDYRLPQQPQAILYRFLDGLHRAIMRIEQPWPYRHPVPNGTPLTFFPRSSKTRISPAQAYILYTTAFKAVVNWPHGFLDFLEAYLHRDGRQVVGTIRPDFGYLYNWLARYWQVPAFRFIQEAFDQYLSKGDYARICRSVPIWRQKRRRKSEYVYPEDWLGQSQQL
jgi:hypothetical protein